MRVNHTIMSGRISAVQFSEQPTSWYSQQSRWVKGGPGRFWSGSRQWSLLPGGRLIWTQPWRVQGDPPLLLPKHWKYREKALISTLITVGIFEPTIKSIHFTQKIQTLKWRDAPLQLWYKVDVEFHLLVRQDKKRGVLFGSVICRHRFITAAGSWRLHWKEGE